MFTEFQKTVIVKLAMVERKQYTTSKLAELTKLLWPEYKAINSDRLECLIAQVIYC